MKIIKYTVLILSVFLLFSCGENLGGLFYSLEQESAITNGSLPDNITIGSMARSGDYYFIASGKFQYKKYNADAATEWTFAPPSGEYSEYLTYDMVFSGSTIYAVFYNTAATSFGVFSADSSKAASGFKWSGPVTFINAPAGETIIGFEASNTKVFIYTTGGTNNYNVYASDLAAFGTGASFTVIAEDISAGGELRADWDGSAYWVTAGNKVYTTDGNTAGTDVTAAVTAVSSSIKGKGFSGVACADTHDSAGVEVYVTSEEGVIAKLEDGAWSWVKSIYDTDTSLFEPLNDIKHINIADEDLDILLAGSENGYYEMQVAHSTEDKTFISPAKTASELTTSIQYGSIAMSEQIMNSFYLDSAAGKIFALGYNSGLWTNSLKKASDGTTYRFWDAE